MGYRGDFEKHFAAREPKAVELYQGMEEVKREAAEFMKVRAVWQFFEAEAEVDALRLFAPGAQEPLHTFRFKRQRQGDFLCLSDYVVPAQNGKRDHLALFVVTAGEGVRERSEKAKNEGYYFKSHGLQALAIESAEACAEWLHRRIREDWGPGGHLEALEAGRDRRAAHRRDDDGSRSQRQCLGVPPSGLHLFQRRGKSGHITYFLQPGNFGCEPG
jgi:cobalamin-dependent methionine synthase I